jgi:hypothetical protein
VPFCPNEWHFAAATRTSSTRTITSQILRGALQHN